MSKNVELKTICALKIFVCTTKRRENYNNRGCFVDINSSNVFVASNPKYVSRSFFVNICPIVSLIKH